MKPIRNRNYFNMAKKTIQQLKKQLDKIFSQYIRLRYSNSEIAICFTCGKTDHWKKMQAGHFMSRRHLNTRWDETNVQVQCVRCNMFNQGEQYKFGKLLDVRIGDRTSEYLEWKSKQILKLSRLDYEEMIAKYKEKVKQLTTRCE